MGAGGGDAKPQGAHRNAAARANRHARCGLANNHAPCAARSALRLLSAHREANATSCAIEPARRDACRLRTLPIRSHCKRRDGRQTALTASASSPSAAKDCKVARAASSAAAVALRVSLAGWVAACTSFNFVIDTRV